MSSEPPKEPTEQKTTTLGAARPPRKEVDLFPPLANKPPAVAPVVAPGNSRLNSQITMYSPVSFEEAVDIVGTLRSRAATTISLEKMRKLDAGRLVDFVCGASAALDGSFHKLTEMVFVFCPANMKIVPAATAQSIGGTRTTIAGGVGNTSTALDFLFSGQNQERSLPGVLRNGI